MLYQWGLGVGKYAVDCIPRRRGAVWVRIEAVLSGKHPDRYALSG